MGVFPLRTFSSGDEVVLAADAQATIAALQARAEQAPERLAALRPGDITAATNARETLHTFINKEQRTHPTHGGVRGGEGRPGNRPENNNAYREQVATLQAELERVRADNKAGMAKRWRRYPD